MERLTKRLKNGLVRPFINGKPVPMHYMTMEEMQERLDRLAAYEEAEERGLLVRLDERLALAMLAGARAIEQNPRKYSDTAFVYKVFGDKPKKISYHDAAKMLRAEAEAALEKG